MYSCVGDPKTRFTSTNPQTTAKPINLITISSALISNYKGTLKRNVGKNKTKENYNKNTLF